jgi:uncharacterized protein YjbI with pentapeptide repeats
MANDEHVAMLKQGVEAWNERRREFPIIPDLINAKLGGADLRGANLDGAFLYKADLSGAALGEAVVAPERPDTVTSFRELR